MSDADKALGARVRASELRGSGRIAQVDIEAMRALIVERVEADTTPIPGFFDDVDGWHAIMDAREAAADHQRDFVAGYRGEA